MKVAAANALATLARQDVPDEVAAAYQGVRPKFGPQYIIPVPFDPRLLAEIPAAVAKAAMDSGVARQQITDMPAYKVALSARRDPMIGVLQRMFQRVRRSPKRVVFAEGEEEQTIRAAVSFVHNKLGTAILIGREETVREAADRAGCDLSEGIEIHNARLSRRNPDYIDYLYARLQRKGYLFRDAQRLVNTDRNHFAACMVALGDADAMVSGVTRNYSTVLDDIRHAIDPKPGHRVIGVSLVLARGRLVLVADTAVHDLPSPSDLADIAEEAAGVAKRLGYTPRVALLAYSTFGQPEGERAKQIREATRVLDQRRVDFEYDGEMAADVALNPALMAAYPFSRLSGPANVLIMPGVPLRVDLDQAPPGAWRLDRHRPTSRRLRQAGADRLARRARFRHRQHGLRGGVQRQRLTGARASGLRTCSGRMPRPMARGEPAAAATASAASDGRQTGPEPCDLPELAR